MCTTAVSGVKQTRRWCLRKVVRRDTGCQAGSAPGQAASRTAPCAVLEGNKQQYSPVLLHLKPAEVARPFCSVSQILSTALWSGALLRH